MHGTCNHYGGPFIFLRKRFRTEVFAVNYIKIVSWPIGWIQPSLRVNQTQVRTEHPFRKRKKCKQLFLQKSIEEPNIALRENCLVRLATGWGNSICTRYHHCLNDLYGLCPSPRGWNVPVNTYALLNPISVIFWVSMHAIQKAEIRGRASVVSLIEFKEQGVCPPS
jgi:hypothetical protein